MRIPAFLKKNDTIALVAPAKKLQADLDPGIELIRSWGLQPVLGKHLYKAHHILAGTDEERLADLQWALDSPQVRAVIMARGGYGMTRILDRLDWSSMKKTPKWICGFSDITSLLIRMDNLSLSSIHGPMVSTLGNDTESDESLRRVLFGQLPEYRLAACPDNRTGVCEGMLIGGNLTMICNAIGTSSEINTEGKLLFLEEVEEYIYHLDRMLVHLKRAKKLDGLRGVLIGDFSAMKDPKDSFGMSAREVLQSHFSKLDIPIAYNIPIGHEHKNLPLVCGIEMTLTIDETGVSLKPKVVRTP